MKEFSREAQRIMTERFGKDTVIALATTENETPYVRYVNAYYENGAFYILTHALSNKMKHIKDNPVVAIAGEWFTAHGEGVSLGYFGKEDNCAIAEKLKNAFAECRRSLYDHQRYKYGFSKGSGEKWHDEKGFLDEALQRGGYAS